MILNNGGIFLGSNSFERAKTVKSFPELTKSFIAKNNHNGLAVSEILRYRHTQSHPVTLFTY